MDPSSFIPTPHFPPRTVRYLRTLAASPLQGRDFTCVSSKLHRDAARWMFIALTLQVRRMSNRLAQGSRGTQAEVGFGPDLGTWVGWSVRN